MGGSAIQDRQFYSKGHQRSSQVIIGHSKESLELAILGNYVFSNIAKFAASVSISNPSFLFAVCLS